jgi:tetratricopeptide (TPR) repeat protein
MFCVKTARSRCRGALAALSCLLLIAGCGGAASRLAHHMERGREYYERGDFVHANVEFRNALQIAPKNVPVRLMAAHSAERLGQFRVAAGIYQSVVDSDPENVEARANLGRLFVMGAAFDRATEIIGPGLAKHPDDPELLTVRASIKMFSNDTAGAEADADHALRVDPDDENAVALRAGLYRSAGDFPHAIASISDALRKHPGAADLRDVLFNLYVSANEPEKAQEELRRLVEMKPKELRYRRLLAARYVAVKQPDEAQRLLEAAVAADSQSNEAKLLLVDFLTSVRGAAEGERRLRSYIEHDAANYELRLFLGQMLDRNGKTSDAIAEYRQIIGRADTQPSGLTARNRIATIEVTQSHFDDASKLVDEVLQKSARDDDALALRAQISMARQDPISAIADIRAVLRDRPKDYLLSQLLAKAYLESGQQGLAEQALRTAIDNDPNDIAARIQLAKLLEQTQRPDQAVTIVEEAVKRAPQNVYAREALILAYVAKRQFAAANTAMDDLTKLRPDAAANEYLAGLIAQASDHPVEAERHFERSLAHNPQAFEPLAALVRVYLSQRQPDQAIAVLQNTIDKNPSNALATNLLGEIYISQKETRKAEERFTRAIELNPHWWVPYKNLALMKASGTEATDAIAVYTRGIQNAPDSTELVASLGQLLERQGRVDEAISVYETAWRRNSHVQMLANNLAMLLVTYKDDRRSLDHARDLVTGFTSSDDGTLLDTNGWVHFKRAEYADALPTLEKAVERSPHSPEIRFHLGMAELQAGRRDRARSDLEAALSGNEHTSWSEEAHTALAGLKARSG